MRRRSFFSASAAFGVRNAAKRRAAGGCATRYCGSVPHENYKQKILIFFKKGIDKPKICAIIEVQTGNPQNRRGRQDGAEQAAAARRRQIGSGKKGFSQGKICTGFSLYRSLSGKRKASRTEKISQTEKEPAEGAEAAEAAAPCKRIGCRTANVAKP